MLGRSFQTALPFAEDLANKSIVLSANSATLLGELVSLSSPVEFETRVGQTVAGAEGQKDHYRFAAEINSSGAGDGRWAASFDHSVETLSGFLNQQVSYIRNTVVPRVMEFAGEALQYIQDLGNKDAASELAIVRMEVPELVSDPSFLSLLERFRNRPVVKPRNTGLNLPFTAAPENFLQIAGLANSRLDGLTAAWSSATSIPYLQSVWYSFFASGSTPRSTSQTPFLSSDDLTSQDLEVRLNASLAYFLITNYYLAHLPDVQIGTSAASLEAQLNEHLVYSGSLLSSTLDRILTNNKANILVTNVDAFHKKITVSADVYDRWLETGGKPEIILGILVGSARFYSVQEIDQNAKQLESAWTQYTRVYLESIEHSKATSLRGFYLGLLAKYLTDEFKEDLEKQFLLGTPKHRDTVLRDAEQYLLTLKKAELSDVQKVARNLIAGLKYSFTHARRFIEQMDEIGLMVENVDPAEAALLATLDYVVDYLRGQISPRRLA